MYNVQRIMNRMSERRGITLIELLISVVLSTVILLVMVRAFKVASEQMTKGRATIEMASQLRNAAETLRSDLENVTVPLRPNSIEASTNGYFTIVEGPVMDNRQRIGGGMVDVAANLNNPLVAGTSYLGDYDDILAMTVRSSGRPFRGRWIDPNDPAGVATVVESYVAEVIWWVKHNDVIADNEVQYAENLTLHRRVLLVRPDLTTSFTNMNDFYAHNDLAARPVAGPGIVMNSLADLAKRENRFAHIRRATPNLGFPHEIDPGIIFNRQLQGERQGEDIVLTGVAAFDVKVFSPNCWIKEFAEQVIDPADPGFGLLGTQSEGAYVDLGFAQAMGFGIVPIEPWFSQYPEPKSKLDLDFVLNGIGRTWCTWSPHYEYDGIDQDGDGLIDQGTDGVDNNNFGGVDDEAERETLPPYPHPIRSLQVTFRLIEKNSGQVRQQTIRHSFVPE